MTCTKSNALHVIFFAICMAATLAFLGAETKSVQAGKTDKQEPWLYQEVSTPENLPTPTPLVTPEPSPTIKVKPTATPLAIPPPSNPTTRSLMVVFGVLIVVVVIVGIWINRERVF